MKFIESIKETEIYLKGKKSYICSVLLAGYAGLKTFDVINTSLDEDLAIYSFLGALLGMSIRGSITYAKNR